MVASFDATGAARWNLAEPGTPSYTSASEHIAVDPGTDDLVLCGDPGPVLDNNPLPPGNKISCSKIDNGGVQLWTQSFPVGAPHLTEVTGHPGGDIILGGDFLWENTPPP